MKTHPRSSRRLLSFFLALVGILGAVAVAQAGSLDGSFGSGGKVSTDNSHYDGAQRVFVLPDGKIMVAGSSASSGFHFYFPTAMLMRYNSNGTLDTSFGTNGKVKGDVLMTVNSVVMQPDGKIVLAGGYDPTWNTPTKDFALVRFNANGSLDTTFGSNGYVITSISSGNESLGEILLLPSGKILAIGGAINPTPPLPQNPNPPAIELARYNSDGSLDNTFGTGGVISIEHGFPSQLGAQGITGAALLPDGRFTVLGYDPSFTGGYLIRFNANGSYDMTFGTGGEVQIRGFDLLLMPNGKYLVRGNNNGSGGGFEIFGLNADGSSDTTFGVNGRVFTTFPRTRADLYQFAVNASGEIYAVGYTADFDGDEAAFALARYSPTGALLGRTTTSFEYPSGASAVAFQPDGKIVVAGTVSPFESDIAVARYFSITNNTGRFRRSYDFNADGRDDIIVLRSGSAGGSNQWFSYPDTFGYVFGLPGDLMAPGDFTGDGVPDVGVFRPSTGYFYYSKNLVSPGTAYTGVRWGTAGDIPVAADYDDDGRTDIAVFRPSQGVWYILNSLDNSFRAVQWGTAGDTPVVGDYDADGKTDIAVYRPSAGVWYILKSSNNQMLAYGFGATGDRPVQADYDGDGFTDIAVFRPSDGYWYSIRSQSGSFFAQQWGANGDTPVPGDYDGDGKVDVAIYRPQGPDGFWYILRSSDSSLQYLKWGFATDTPVPGN